MTIGDGVWVLILFGLVFGWPYFRRDSSDIADAIEALTEKLDEVVEELRIFNDSHHATEEEVDDGSRH